jgi:hypothetical protein
MKIFNAQYGRFGNSIFIYLASVLLCILYDGEIIGNENEINYHIDDNFFIHFMNENLQGNDFFIDKNANYKMNGYCQHDEIYKKYKKEIIDYIKKHPNDLLITDGNHENESRYHFKKETYKSIDVIQSVRNIPKYDVVLHLRLEDFINYGFVIHPKSMMNVLEKIGKKDICIVTNEPKIEIEKKYITYLKKYFTVTIESNDVVTDYHIMKNANILVCQCSTVSWAAALMSETIGELHLPNYKNKPQHKDRYWETFSKPIENTILYDYEICSKNELEDFLNSEI